MELWRVMRRWLRDHPVSADALLAALVFVGGITFAVLADVRDLHAGPHLKYHAVSVVGVLLQLLYAVALMARRNAPIAALVLFSAASITAELRVEADLTAVALIICVYSLARYRPPRPALTTTAICTAFGLVSLPFTPQPGRVAAGVFMIVCVAIPFLIGREVRTRRAYIEVLEDRAFRAEAERESTARTAVMDERRRIARELHDLVAHHVSVMRVLAEGSRRLLPRDPVRVDQALSQIDGLGREALREMRRILDVLRSDDEPEESPTEPNPGTGSLGLLVEQVRRAGLPVDLDIDGAPRALSASAELATYRIVQEALTNTLKHAGPAAQAQVRVRYGTHQLEIDVSDDGRGASARRADGGHGLLGMRERVGVYGGELSVGPRPGGGFIVHATLPYDTLAAELGPA